MKFGIVVDSSCDLVSLKNNKEKIDFSKAPLKLDIGEKSYIDDESLNIKEFMKEMYAYNGKSGSAAPSPSEWLSGFEKSDYIFALTITSKLSGCYSSAKIAEEMLKESYPEKKVYVMDTLSTGPKMSLIALKIEELINEGLSFEEICEKINEYKERTHLLFVLQSLENLIKNGRVSRLSGSIAGILGIKILGIASKEGNIELLLKGRGKKGIYDKTIKEIQRLGFKGGKIIISNCLNIEGAEYIKDEILKVFPNSSIEVMPAGGLCSFYAEEGGLLIGFEIE